LAQRPLTDPVSSPLPTLLVVPTEAHVELALSKERSGVFGGASRVRSARTFVREAVAALIVDRVPATPLSVSLATHVAAKEVAGERLLPGSGETPTEATSVALGATLDRTIGALRRSARGAAGPGNKRSLAVWAAAVQERVDVRLRAAGFFDARGAGALLARYFAGATDEVLADLGVLGGATFEGVFPWDGDDALWIEALHRRSKVAGGAGVVLRLPQFEGESGEHRLANAAFPLADVLEKRWAGALDAPEIEWTSAPLAKVVAVRSAQTADAEARAVAAAVLDALSAGIAPERIAIVVPRTSDDSAAPICAALAEARVAFAEPRGRSIVPCPDGRAALGLLALAEGPFTRDGILEVLRAPGLHAGIWVEAADETEAATRASRLASRLREVPVDVDGSGRGFVDGLAALVAEQPDDAWMPRAMERLVASARWLAEGGTFREGLRRFTTLLDRAKLGQPSARELWAALGDEKRGFGSLALSAMGENASAVRRLREVVVELGGAAETLGFGGAPLSVAEMRALVRGLAERTGARAGGSAARAGAVRIGRPEEIAGLPFDRVIVTGLVDSAYGDEGEEEDLLGGQDEEGPEGRAKTRAPRRTLALAAVLASAREAVLAYATGDDADIAKPHAVVVDAIEQGVPVRAEPASRVSARASLLGPRSEALVALVGGRPPTADLAERVRIERERYAFFMDPRADAGDFTGRVRLTAGLDALLPRLVGGASERSALAVTAIEKAAGCAFAGFARRVLRIRKAEDLAEAGDARERGTLVHKALSAVFEAARDARSRAGAGEAQPSPSGGAAESGWGGSAADRRAAFAAARSAAERALEIEKVTSPLRREALLSAVRDALVALSWAWNEDESVQFLFAEQMFGGAMAAPWGALPLAPGDDEPGAPTVYVEGRIDRVDATGDRRRVRVIDYKTGRLPQGEEAVIALQLPLYAAAAGRALGASQVEAMYLSVRTRGIIDESPKRPEARVAKAAEFPEKALRARKAVLALWEGRVAPRPAFLSLCAQCDARDVCRRPAVMPIEEMEEKG
jgi:ATP-dependent helicase/nuclease subunit B